MLRGGGAGGVHARIAGLGRPLPYGWATPSLWVENPPNPLPFPPVLHRSPPTHRDLFKPRRHEGAVEGRNERKQKHSRVRARQRGRPVDVGEPPPRGGPDGVVRGVTRQAPRTRVCADPVAVPADFLLPRATGPPVRRCRTFAEAPVLDVVGKGDRGVRSECHRGLSEQPRGPRQEPEERGGRHRRGGPVDVPRPPEGQAESAAPGLLGAEGGGSPASGVAGAVYIDGLVGEGCCWIRGQCEFCVVIEMFGPPPGPPEDATDEQGGGAIRPPQGSRVAWSSVNEPVAVPGPAVES